MTVPPTLQRLLAVFAVAASALVSFGAHADEAAIRKNLAERVPRLPKIDEVSSTPIPGLYEIRINGSDILYTDSEGNYLVQGNIMDTKAQRDLTEERIAKLSAVSFDSLPVKDAFTIVRGNGKRRLAVFEDPNCGYCKHFEADLQKVDNVTIQLYLYPILGGDSPDKARAIWCAKDKGKTWQDWMVRSVAIPNTGPCDAAALARNVEFGRKYKITGTPTLIFADGNRVPGAIGADQVEKLLADASK